MVKEYKNHEVTQKVLELQESMLDLQSEVRRLEADNARLREELRVADTLTWKAIFYEAVDRPGERFCGPCWDGSRKLVHLIEGEAGMEPHLESVWRCQVCKSTFKPVS